MKQLNTALLILCMLWLLPVQAEQSVRSGEYEIHYNAITTNQLTAMVASHYGISRSSTQAMLNVTVLKKASDDDLGTAVSAEVAVTSRNLTGQMQAIDMRKIEEQDAIYYIGLKKVRNLETLHYQITVTADEMNEPITIKYTTQFYTD